MNFTGLSIIQRPTLVTDWRTLEEWNKSKPQESVGTTLLYQSIAGILTLFPQLVGCLVVSSPVARLTGSDTWGATGNLLITGETRETSPLHPTYEQRPAAGAGAEAQVWLRCRLGGRSRSQWTDDVLGGSQSRFLSFLLFILCPMMNDDYVIPERMKILLTWSLSGISQEKQNEVGSIPIHAAGQCS